jgi:hypothetical protein
MVYTRDLVAFLDGTPTTPPPVRTTSTRGGKPAIRAALEDFYALITSMRHERRAAGRRRQRRLRGDRALHRQRRRELALPAVMHDSR